MKTFYLFLVMMLAVSFWGKGQVNIVVNPSFENIVGCPNGLPQIDSAIGWHKLLKLGGGTPDLYNSCFSPDGCCGVPYQNNYLYYQVAHTGNGFAGIELGTFNHQDDDREYIQSKLIHNLQTGNTYCVKFYAILHGQCLAYITKLGAYFDDASIAATSASGQALVNPQIYNSLVPLDDKINWMKIEGAFTANYNCNYITIGDFFTNTDAGLTSIDSSGVWWLYYFIDDVSVIDVSTPAFAGNDVLITQGDSTYIGRPSEIGLDEDCFWFVNGIPIDTIAGMWVKPANTTTYILQQDICGVISYDTITVTVSGVGIEQFGNADNSFKLYPNPATNILSLECSNEITSVNISDISGKTLIYNSPNKAIANIDISSLAKGMYFIRVISNNQSGVGRFLKE